MSETQTLPKVELKETNVKINDVDAGSVTTVTWEGDFKKEDIIHIQPSCGCTAKLDWQDGVISAEYTADTKERLEQRNPDLETLYPSGKIPTVKSLSVYINDGEDLKVLNDRGFEIYNPNKERLLINFNGYIKYK